MKIGISSPYLESLAGGERYILTIAYCLSKNYDVEIFWHDKKIAEKAFERLAIDLNRVKIVEDIFYSKQNLLKKKCSSYKYNLIIFLSDGSLPLSFAQKNIIHFQNPLINIKGKSLLNKIKLRKFNAIICNSYFTKRFIDQEYGVNSLVIYPPVSIKEFKTEIKEKMILSVGRFHPLKKQLEIIRIFQKLTQDLPEWQLILAGGLLPQDKDYYLKLQEMSNHFNIKLMPNIDFDVLKKFYARAAIYWHGAGFEENEENNPSAMEHFGITTVESMAAECVPIVFSGGGQKEIIKHRSNGFLWLTEEDLKRYTLEISRDNSLRIKIAKQAKKDSQYYSVDRFCQEINKLVQNL